MIVLLIQFLRGYMLIKVYRQYDTAIPKGYVSLKNLMLLATFTEEGILSLLNRTYFKEVSKGGNCFILVNTPTKGRQYYLLTDFGFKEVYFDEVVGGLRVDLPSNIGLVLGSLARLTLSSIMGGITNFVFAPISLISRKRSTSKLQ